MLRAGYGSSTNKTFFDSAPSFNKLWNTEVLSELTLIEFNGDLMGFILERICIWMRYM